MRVLAVTPWFPTATHSISGVFTLRDIELLARNHRVTVLHLCRPDWAGEPGVPSPAGVKVLRVPFSITKPWTFPTAIRAIRRAVRHADLVHTMALPALLITRFVRPKLPWVHTEHFSTLVTPPTNFLSRVLRSVLVRSFRAPNETVAVGEALASVMDTFRRRKSSVIPNMVQFPKNGRTAKAGSDKQELQIIAVGGLIERKGPLQAVETVASLLEKGRPAKLTWVGDGPLLQAVQGRAEALGVSGNCEWLGELSPEEVSNKLSESDLFLLPVVTETFGVAMAEALAHGLPVVATGTGGHEEFLPPQASRIVESRDGVALAGSVLELMESSDSWSSEEIANYAWEIFSEDRREIDYERVYSKALSGNSETNP